MRSSWPILPVQTSTRLAFVISRSGRTFWNRPRVRSSAGEDASGWRSMLLREHHQRLAPRTQRLPPQHVEILRGSGGLAELDVVARGELQEALDARAGVLRPLAFVAVRQQQHQSGEQAPLVLARGDELVNDDLRAVGEVPELRLPQHQ